MATFFNKKKDRGEDSWECCFDVVKHKSVVWMSLSLLLYRKLLNGGM